MPVRSLCFSPDSQLLVTASDDKDMKIYDVLVGCRTCQPQSHIKIDCQTV